MLSFLRATAPPRTATAEQSTILYEDGQSSQTFYGPSEKYFVRHYIPNSKSMFNPPPHIHFYQTEEFFVEKGQGIWYQPSTDRPAERETPKSTGETIFLPAGTYHQFRNPSETDPLVVRFRIDPKLSIVREECFFRNFFGYLEDCRAAKMEPSIFQLQLFLLTVESGIAIPVPGPVAVKWWTSRLMMLLLGVVIGEWLLGYKRSYPEYYRGRDTE